MDSGQSRNLRAGGASPATHRSYYMAYYVEGIAAIIKEWRRQSYADGAEKISKIIQSCVGPKGGSHEA